MKFWKTAMIIVVLGAAIVTVSSPYGLAADLANGKKVFNKCMVCHKLTVGKKSIGPNLYRVFNRTAGTSTGFKYSKDMIAAGAKGLVWDEKSMDDFLATPKPFIGNIIGKKRARIKMAFRGLKKVKDRADIIAYLKNATK